MRDSESPTVVQVFFYGIQFVYNGPTLLIISAWQGDNQMHSQVVDTWAQGTFALFMNLKKQH